MINKEIILSADGSIKKDFQERNIPQNSNNQVSVNVLIPSTCFTGLSNYAVILGVSRIISNQETTLNSLIMTASKSITIEGVLYIKYSAILSYSYTDKIATLKVSPYIQTTATTLVEDVATEVITIQQAFTNSNLNVIKSVLPQYDASLEEGTIATTLAEQIAGKKIYTFIDTDSASLGEHYYSLVNGYDPNADQFNGCIVMSVFDGETRQYIPYLNDSDVELLEITKGGVFYNISGVDYSNSTYTYTRQQISYSKIEIDNKVGNLQTQINDKVDKTTKVNNHALSSDITLDSTDVGLGNVANYGVETTPTASGSNLYITSKGVYDALQLVYSALNGYATTGDLSAINTRLEAVESVIGDGTDDDNVINTLYEVIQVLNGLGEGASLLDLINAKANQTDLTALSGVVNAMGLKVDVLYDSNANAYMEIKAQSGTIDILTSDWVANTDDYASDYPYKWTLSNGYLVGASNVIVVFSVDSDTSLLSTSVAIDDTNGSITIYASETPSDTISIEKVAVFNNVNAYINYSQTIVSQVNANTSAISDINNTKLPQYVKLYNTQAIDICVVGDDYTNHLIGLGKTSVVLENMYKESSSKNIVSNVLLKDGIVKVINSTWESGSKTSEHTLTFDSNGALKIDGNAVGGGGGHKVIKCFNQAIEPYMLNGNAVGGVWCITATAIGYGVATDTATGNTPTSFETGDIVLGYSQVEHGTFGDPDFYAEDILNRVLVVNEQIQSGDVLLQFQQLAQYSESRMLTTATTPTDTAGVLTLSAANVNEGGGKVGDYISYISSGSISALYKITAVNYVNDAFVYTIELVGNIGGGKQLYQHNICFGANPWLQIEIINDSPTEIQNYSDIVNYIKDKGFTHSGNASLASGTITKWHKLSGTSGTVNYIGIYYNTISNNLVALQTSNYLEINFTPSVDNDVVIPL